MNIVLKNNMDNINPNVYKRDNALMQNKISNNVELKEEYRKIKRLQRDTINFSGKGSNMLASDKKGYGISEIVKRFNNPIKMFFTDIDGTIRDYKGKIPLSAKGAIEKLRENKIPVILATGRSNQELKPVLNQLGFTPDYLITEQGACVLNKTGDILFQDTLNDKDTYKIIELAKEYKEESDKEIELILYIDGKPVACKGGCDLPTNKGFVETIVVDSFDNLLKAGKKPTKALFLKKSSKNIEEMNGIKNYLRENLEENLNVFNSGIWYCEVTNKTVSKGQAIRFLSKDLSIDLKNMSGIGDAENDLDMMRVLNKEGGLSVAMGNAQECLKTEAKFVTDDITKDGYAKAVELILENNNRLSSGEKKGSSKLELNA